MSNHDDAVEFVEEKVFVPANVQEDGDDFVDYVIDEVVFCEDKGESCRRDLENLWIQAHVVSRTEGGIEADVSVSRARLSLATLHIRPDELALSPDLAELEEALGYIEDILDVDLSLPEVMRGAVRVSLRDPVDGRILGTPSVDSAVDVQDDDFAITLAPADPALHVELGFDDAMLQIDSSLEARQVRGWNHTFDYDTYESSSDQLELRFDALQTFVRLPLQGRKIEVVGLTFGDGPLEVYGNGQPEASLTLDAAEGAQFQASAEMWENGVDWSVEPTFDITLDMKFQALRRQLPRLGDWTKDERLQLALEPAAPAAAVTMSSSSDGLRVEQGSVRLSSERANVRYDVAAGECLYEGSSSGAGYWMQRLEVGSSCR